jgi:hypothetical protein
MTTCVGQPAEKCALEYLEGTLPETEAERFEEHYFDCPACLEYLQTLQAVGRKLADHPVAQAPPIESKKIFAWPVRSWALGAAAAALLVAGFFVYRASLRPAPAPTVANSAAPAPVTAPTPAPAPAPAPAPKSTTPAQPKPQPAAQIGPAQLADLALPAFAAAHLRGESEDEHFEKGMAEYAHGQCSSALDDLAQVSAESRSLLAAQFYSGTCQMHERDYYAAQATLQAVADQGDSPQQEASLYYLAQVALARGDAPAAHGLLLRTIALNGDFEARARAEDSKLLALEASERQSGAK